MSAGIDAVVVSYNRRDLLTRCLDSLLAASPAPAIVVVDNASTDGSPEVVGARYPRATLIRNDTNIGFGAAVNLGVARGEAPHVLLLNSDATVADAALERMAAVLDSDSRLAAVGPRIVDADGTVELSTGRTMSLGNEAWFKLAATLGGTGGRVFGSLLRRRYAVDRDVGSLTGACMLMRRRAYAAVGGFDERFFLYAEDVDLCRRWIADGWRLRYVAGATVRHLRGASGSADPVATALAYRASQLAFYAKHRSAASQVLLRAYLACRARLGSLAGRSTDRALLQWLRRGRGAAGTDAAPREDAR